MLNFQILLKPAYQSRSMLQKGRKYLTANNAKLLRKLSAKLL